MGTENPALTIGWVPKLIGKYTPRVLSGWSLIGSGWSLLVAAVPALAMTMATYYLVNTKYLIPRITRQYETARLPAFDGVDNNKAAADRVIEVKWADPKIQPWLREVMMAPTADYPARCQAVSLFRIPGQREIPAEYEAELRRHSTGQMKPDPRLPAFLARVYECFPVSAETSSGTEALQALARLQDKRWLKAIEAQNQSYAEEKKRFVARYLEALETEIRGPVRKLRRYNGWIQWVTVAVAWLIIFLVTRRWLLINKLRYSACLTEEVARKQLATVKKLRDEGRPDEANEALSKLPDKLHSTGSEMCQIVWRFANRKTADPVSELEQVRAAVNSGTYGLFGNLVSTLPALGFVGTILGMGEALTNADGLFGAQEKQVVIGQITRGLGYAFDATLVALVTAIVASLMLALMRMAEQRMFRDWSAVLSVCRQRLLQAGK